MQPAKRMEEMARTVHFCFTVCGDRPGNMRSLLRRDGAAGKNDGVKGRDAWAWVLVQLWHGGRRVTSYLHADGGRVRLVGG